MVCSSTFTAQWVSIHARLVRVARPLRLLCLRQLQVVSIHARLVRVARQMSRVGRVVAEMFQSTRDS